ncbi:MAG: DUF445 domain-containing protein [Bacteroidia bacterium]|nr:DUF445 domain-containing protein [Bacteroidia bacterium]
MNEAELKRIKLQKLKRTATFLLFCMVILLLAARGLHYYYPIDFWQALAAFAEAGMVGALADWYAVTALFKHPLGLKIPHTNLIAIKKDKFALKMGEFIQQHFLKKESIAQKIKEIEFTHRLAQWLQEQSNQQKIITAIENFIPLYLAQLEKNDLDSKLQQVVIDFIQKSNAENYFYQLLEKIITEKHHQKLLEIALQAIILQVDNQENRKKIHEQVSKKSPAFVPKFVDKIYTDSFLQAIKSLANEIKNNPKHDIRYKFDEKLLEWIEKLKTAPEYQQKVIAIKEMIVQNPFFREHTRQVWTKVKDWLLEELKKPQNQVLIQKQIQEISQKLMQDETLRQKIDAWLQVQIVQVVESNQEIVKEHISTTIRRWDSKSLAEQIELEVGKDLQYIRINGTLVGGTIGLILYLTTEFLPKWIKN